MYADSIINCESDKNSIKNAINHLYSKEFREVLKSAKNPYGEGGKLKNSIKIGKFRFKKSFKEKLFSILILVYKNINLKNLFIFLKKL